MDVENLRQRQNKFGKFKLNFSSFFSVILCSVIVEGGVMFRSIAYISLHDKFIFIINIYVL